MVPEVMPEYAVEWLEILLAGLKKIEGVASPVQKVRSLRSEKSQEVFWHPKYEGPRKLLWPLRSL